MSFRKARGVKALCFRRVTDALVLSTLGYYSVFLESANTPHPLQPNSTRLRGLRTLYRKVLRPLISAPSSIHIVIMHLLCDKPSLVDYIRGNCASYWSKLQKSSGLCATATCINCGCYAAAESAVRRLTTADARIAT